MSVFNQSPDDEHGIFGDPPRETSRLTAAQEMLFDFRKVSLPDVSPVWELSHVLLRLATARLSPRLTRDERDSILEAIVRARAVMMSVLPPSYDRRQIHKGMQAASGIVIHWAESDEQRAARHPDVLRDMYDYMRMFRNDLHNACLIEWIADRKAKRLAETVSEIRKNATRVA